MTMQQLTSATAAMTALADAYNGKMSEINTAINTAAQNVGATFRQFHVDAVNGSDAAAGGSSAPLATIEEALARSVWGGRTRINLLSDVEIQSQPNIRASALEMNLAGYRLSFAPVGSTDANATAAFLAGDGQGFAHIRFFNGKIRLQNMPQAGSVPRGVIRQSQGPISVNFGNCELEHDPVPEGNTDQFQSLLRLSSPCFLVVTSTVFPQTMAGRWIQSVGAGALPDATGKIVHTNLSSL